MDLLGSLPLLQRKLSSPAAVAAGWGENKAEKHAVISELLQGPKRGYNYHAIPLGLFLDGRGAEHSRPEVPGEWGTLPVGSK